MRDPRKTGHALCQASAYAEIGERLPEAVLQRNFIPNPSSKDVLEWSEAVIAAVAKPFMQRTNYTEQAYREIHERIPAPGREESSCSSLGRSRPMTRR
jgi:hypothetical protein